MVAAGALGLGAGIVGAAIYYAVIAITHLEIGIVAILIGYMVGRAVRKGARGHGGLRFQIDARSTQGSAVPLIDGGAFDWVARLASNGRLVFVASGMGSQLAAYLYRVRT